MVLATRRGFLCGFLRGTQDGDLIAEKVAFLAGEGLAGDLEDAREQATQYRDANDDPIYIALCAAAAGNVAECSSLLLECVSDDGYHFATTVLADPHWKMYLGNDRFVALKQALEAQATIETTEYGLQLE